jgi:ribose 5-phosphate isomerase A
VILVDESKLVDRLGHRFAVPVEVVPFGRCVVENELRKIGGTPTLRCFPETDQPFVTDSGQWILDCAFDGVPDPAGLELKINAIPGVVENGLFVGMAETVLVGRPNGVESLQRPGRR